MSSIKKLLICTGASLLSAGVIAGEPANFKVGAFEVTPTLGVTYKHDDNIFKSDRDEEDSWILEINPHIRAEAKERNNVYGITLDVVDGSYTDSHDDDFTDYSVSGDAHLEFSARAQLDLNAGTKSAHDDRGSAFSEGAFAATIAEPDEYDEDTYGMAFTIGSDESKGRLVIDADVMEKDYTNHEPATDTRDYEATNVGATLYWQVMPKTALFLEGHRKDFDYDEDLAGGINQDSEETSFYLGVEWEATGKTTGSIKLGQLEKDFDDPTRKTFDENSWAANITWTPKEYSTINIGTSRTPGESTGTGSFIDTEDFTLSWENQWSERVSSKISARIATEEYTQTPREDDTTDYSVTLSYEMRRWLSFDLGYSYKEKDSNAVNLDYEKNVISVGVKMSL